MLQQENPDDFVIATGKSYSVENFLETVFQNAGLEVEKCVEIDQRLMRPHEVPYLLGDPAKAREKLNWEPSVDFEALCNMMYQSDLKYISETNKQRRKT